jgi:hypothetical protein
MRIPQSVSSVPLLRSKDMEGPSFLVTDLYDTATANARRLQRMLLISSVTGPCEARGWAVTIHCPVTLPNLSTEFCH